MLLKIVFMLATSADSDEMPLYSASNLGLYCLPEFTGILNENQIGLPNNT